MSTKWILYEPAKTTVTRIIPELAVEIGLNESIVLLQISFWLSISNNERDGKFWTYQSLRDMKEKVFPYWSHETIRKAINSLKTSGYIMFGNYNANKYDKTQWFALEPDKCSSLKSVLCAASLTEENPVKKLDSLSRNLTRKPQNLTTIPEITTETTQNKDVASKAAKRKPDPEFDAIAKVWNITAGGWVSNIQGMIFGTKKVKGEWLKCKFEPPATVSEVECFEPYLKQRMAEKRITDIPTAAVTVQRWFYDYRAEVERKHLAALKQVDFDPSKWTVPEVGGD